ncbi:PucR family transcriptional regulator [Prauserella oleivorans]|uniref:PucR family transcriptional regulator n=1 Tax=Prauserella oleivorans TaxID=1478153 RepID=A0ABW5W701_9PSEU
MVTLDRLVNVLGGYGARLIGPRAERDVELHSVAMHDPTADEPVVGDVFLAVGVPSVTRGLELAAQAHSRAVLVRGASGPDTAEQARRAGLAVLVVDPAVSWSQVAGAVYGLVLEGRETEAGRGPSDLFALADTLAGAVGGAVTIEDPHSRVMAYSGAQQDADPARHDTILGRRVPEPVRELFERRGVFAHLAASDAPLFVPAAPEHGLHGRMVVAVRAGRELLGSVWVACRAPLDDRRRRVFAEGAHTVALHLLRSRISADLERQVESELVIELLDGTADAAAVIGKLGLPPGRLRVVALQAHTDERHGAILLAFERATTGFGWSRPGRSTMFGNTVYTVLPAGEDAGPARDWLRDITAGLPGHVTFAAGIGGAAGPGELPASRQEADESLALHALHPHRDVVSYEQSWDEILLQRLRTAASAGRIPDRGPIAELARHDAVHGTGYLRTLRAWLECHGDRVAAAAELGVHQNTVRYRLRKMAEIADLGLADPRKRLAMLITLAVADEPGPFSARTFRRPPPVSHP